MGGLLTSLTEQRGTVHLTPGVPTSRIVLDSGCISDLPYPVTLAVNGQGELTVTCNGRTCELKANNFATCGSFRLYPGGPDGVGGAIVTAVSDPLGTGVTYAGYLMFAIGAVAMLLCGMGRRNGNMGAVLPVALRSPWLAVHVPLMAAGYLMAGVAAPASLILHIRKKSAKGNGERCFKFLKAGTLLLGLGIISGAVWANQAWGRYWGWDPKETWALVTFILFALPLHRASGLRQRPTLMLGYLMLCIAAIVMTAVVPQSTPSLHAYHLN